MSSVIALVFAYATNLEGFMLYVFMAIMFAIIATILFFMYLTFSKKYDYHPPRPDYKSNYNPDYNNRSFSNSRKGLSGIVKAFIMTFAFLTLLGVSNYFLDVFAMFHSGLDFVDGLINGALGTPVVDSVVDMIIGAIWGD